MKRASTGLWASAAALGLLLIGNSLAACDSILGIDPFPDLPSDAGSIADGTDSATPAARDATLDSPKDTATDAPVDVAVDQTPAPVDAGLDSADAGGDSSTGPDGAACTDECALGEATCIDPNVIETCILGDAGCRQWDNGSPCQAGTACWGGAGAAYCCNGTADYCAPSCHVVAAGNPDGGNGQTNCGPNGNERCCTSLEVEGGTYLRSYDGNEFTTNTNPATVSTFALDKYEVTVGRFRQFVNAVNNFWQPEDGSGVHTHLNGGKGLVDSSGGSPYEAGWLPAYAALLPMTQGDWDNALGCGGGYGTWTPTPGPLEAYPINCVTWEQAYAFCIWDGGFLPSESEWNYAAAGGSQQRVYAWSNPPTSQLIDCTYANYAGPCFGQARPVGMTPNGDGRWGQSDLTGNVFEWTLDYFAAYSTPCLDCAYLTNLAGGTRTIRGQDWTYPANQEYVATRTDDPDTIVYKDDGIRCARAP